MPFPRASKALARFTVLDLTRVRAGPTCARQLADWGANVIKIETPAHLEKGEGPGGPEWLDKRFFEVEPAAKIFAAILLSFAEHAFIHHVEHEFTEVFAPANAPIIEHGFRHRAELVQGVLAEAVQ